MRPVTEHTPAASRSAAAARLAAVAGLGVLLGLGLLGTGLSSGFFLALASLLALLVLLRRRMDAADLAAIGSRPVAEVAHAAPTLAGAMTGPELMNKLAEHPDASHWLVESDHGWLVAPTTVLMDTALTTTGSIEVYHLGRRVRHVDGTMAVDRLPRIPLPDEVWVVDVGENGLLVCRQDLVDARLRVPDATAPAPPDAPLLDLEPESAAQESRAATVVLPASNRGVPA